MLKHDQVWTAIDSLAAKHGMSASGLARRAGLDPTTFNKSKRMTGDGRQRWPSTESIAKVLQATGETLDGFVGLIGADRAPLSQKMPLIGSTDAGARGSFGAEGRPAGTLWSEIALPGIGDPAAFALELDAGHPSPLYREGDVLVVLPGAALRRGDRVFVRLTSGETLIGEVRRQTAAGMELARSGVGDAVRAVSQGETAFAGRILWASQ